MGFLKRLFKREEPQGLSRPNFESSPWVEVDFSGTKIKFSDPKHTGDYPVDDRPHDLDIYDEFNYQKWGQSLAKKFYVKGWNFWDRSSKTCVGGVDTSGFLYQYFTEKTKSFDAFNKSDMGNEVLEFCHSSWGDENKAKSKGDIGTGYYKYPTAIEELDFLEINGATCCRVSAERKGRPPKLNYFFPISSKHILAIYFDFLAYSNFDYFDPSLNLEVLCQEVMEEFMRNFTIKLSADALTQKNQASNG